MFDKVRIGWLNTFYPIIGKETSSGSKSDNSNWCTVNEAMATVLNSDVGYMYIFGRRLFHLLLLLSFVYDIFCYFRPYVIRRLAVFPVWLFDVWLFTAR
jgi:hypothetical protein